MSKLSARTHLSDQQKDKLVDLVNSNRELLETAFRADFTREDCIKRWKYIASELNTLPGANKDWRQWRKTWQDIKTRIKPPVAFAEQNLNDSDSDSERQNSKNNFLNANFLERELNLKSSYYERKLQLMERQVIALERIADAVTAVNVSLNNV